MDTKKTIDIRELLGKHLFNWEWRPFALVAIAAIPIFIVAFFNTKLAFAMVIGLIPAAFGGVGPTRKSRLLILVLGVIIPVSLIIGSLLSEYTNRWVAGIVLALLAFMAAFMMTRGKLMWLNLIVPIVAIGLSFTDIRATIGFFAIMLAESLFAFLISLLFPQRVPPARPEIPKVSKKQASTFGILYGLALFTSTMVSWGWDHMGWVVGSTGLVMRPSTEMQKFRSVWRAVSILGGLIVVSAFLLLQPSNIPAVLFAIIIMALCAGFNKSRAYIMPFFMTICVFMMIEYPISGIDEVWQRFLQRLIEVGLGIAIALFFRLAIPAIMKFIQERQHKNSSMPEHEPDQETPQQGK